MNLRTVWTALGLALAVGISISTASTEVEVSGTGYGDTQAEACDDAMQRALSQAVQQALGVRVSVTSLAGIESLFYQSFVEARGVIERYEEVGSATYPDEMSCQRTIRAWVAEVPDAAVQEFIRQVHRVGIYIQEPEVEGTPTMTALQQALTAQGMQVVDLSPAGREVEALMRAQDKRPLLRRYLVDAVIATNPIRIVAGNVGAEGQAADIISRRAEAAAKLVFVDQPDVPYNADESLKAVGPASVEARLIGRAHQNFGRKLADVFGPILDDHFEPTSMTVILQDMPDMMTFTGLTRSLRSVLAPNEVVPGEFHPDRAEITVNYGEGADPGETRLRVASVLEDAGARILGAGETVTRASFARDATPDTGGTSATDDIAQLMDTKTLIIAVLGLFVIALAVIALRRGKGGSK